jgi:ABC-type Mn2+/Zn2+ transport system ATPase subunit
MPNKRKDVISSDPNIVLEAGTLDIGYSNDTVVADINFQLHQGEAMALIGTNGCGKSTLLKTIVGLIPSLSGRLSVFGMPPGKNHVRVAYLGQFHQAGFVLPIRVKDIVRMGRFPQHGLWRRLTKQDDEMVSVAMQIMGIENLAELSLRSLSGGQQQRVYLAQTLSHQADLLVLDEPATGLDVGGRKLYLQAIYKELHRGASVILATHDIQDEAIQCQQVMLLARRVIAIGVPEKVLTPEALLNTFGIVSGKDDKIHILETEHGHSGYDYPTDK